MNDDRHKARPERVGSILDTVLNQTGLSRRSRERSVLDDWPDVVGERVAEHTQAVDIEDGVLFIEADHAAWRQELTMLFPAIIEKYNTKHGEGTVREVRWRRGGTR